MFLQGFSWPKHLRMEHKIVEVVCQQRTDRYLPSKDIFSNFYHLIPGHKKEEEDVKSHNPSHPHVRPVPILICSSQTDNQARLPCIQSWDLILKPVLLHSTLTDLLSGLTCPVSDKEIGQLQNLILESAESAANIFVYMNT